MFSVGIDSIEICRIEKAMKNPRLCRRVFGEAEYSLLAMRGFSAQSAAASFCAKEAFSKALGTGIRGFRLSEVELLRDDVGAPFLQLSGNALKIARERGLRFSVSVTHTRELATVIVIAEKEEVSE